jgi:hypothetical protein
MSGRLADSRSSPAVTATASAETPQPGCARRSRAPPAPCRSSRGVDQVAGQELARRNRFAIRAASTPSGAISRACIAGRIAVARKAIAGQQPGQARPRRRASATPSTGPRSATPRSGSFAAALGHAQNAARPLAPRPNRAPARPPDGIRKQAQLPAPWRRKPVAATHWTHARGSAVSRPPCRKPIEGSSTRPASAPRSVGIGETGGHGRRLRAVAAIPSRPSRAIAICPGAAISAVA